MTEGKEVTDMDEPHKPSPLEDAIAFLEEQDETYTDEALYDALVDAGYPSDVASEALRQREAAQIAAEHEATTDRTPAGASGNDERSRAALALLGGAALAWLACAAFLWVISPDGLYGGAGIALVILAVVLTLALLVALMAAGVSGSLRRGAEGAVGTFLVIPFVVFFGLAGTCVVITSGFLGE